MKYRIAMFALLVAGFIVGYFWPRAHYEIRDTRLCAIAWDGTMGCSQLEQTWVPEFPQ